MIANHNIVREGGVVEIIRGQNKRTRINATHCAAVGSVAGMIAAAAATASVYELLNDDLWLGGALMVVAVAVLIALLVCVRESIRASSVLQSEHLSEWTNVARLAAAGEVSASIIHEVTQPLSAMLVNIEAMALALAKPVGISDTAREIISDMRRDHDRANRIVQRLRNLLSKRDMHLERIELNRTVTNVLALIRADMRKRNVVLSTNLSPDLPSVAADPVQLQQLLLNLFVNAMQAMTDTPAESRRLQVSTHRFNSENVEIVISDTGTGMTRQQSDQAFELFYTTKKSGMGLGLSIARTIVLAHRGNIWIERGATGGANIHVTIPFESTIAAELISARRLANTVPALTPLQPYLETLPESHVESHLKEQVEGRIGPLPEPVRGSQDCTTAGNT